MLHSGKATSKLLTEMALLAWVSTLWAEPQAGSSLQGECLSLKIVPGILSNLEKASLSSSQGFCKPLAKYSLRPHSGCHSGPQTLPSPTASCSL